MGKNVRISVFMRILSLLISKLLFLPYKKIGKSVRSTVFMRIYEFVISKSTGITTNYISNRSTKISVFLRPLKNIVFIGLLEGLKIFHLKIVLSTFWINAKKAMHTMQK